MQKTDLTDRADRRRVGHPAGPPLRHGTGKTSVGCRHGGRPRGRDTWSAVDVRAYGRVNAALLGHTDLPWFDTTVGDGWCGPALGPKHTHLHPNSFGRLGGRGRALGRGAAPADRATTRATSLTSAYRDQRRDDDYEKTHRETGHVTREFWPLDATDGDGGAGGRWSCRRRGEPGD